MDLDQEFLACDAMLARLNAAMASAEAEARHASALETRLRRILSTLDLGGTTFDPPLPSAAGDPGLGRSPAGRSGPGLRRAPERPEQATPIRVAPGRLHRLLRLPEGASARHP